MSVGKGHASEEGKRHRDRSQTQAADEIRIRAVSGEDFHKLQAQAFASAGIKVAPPKTAMEKRTRDDLPRDRATVFDLNPGQVSPVIVDPAGYYIYKIDSKSVQPLSEVEQAIRTALRQQNLERLVDAVTHSAKTELNRTYFNAFEKPLEFGGPEPPEESGDLSAKPVPGRATSNRPSKARPDSPK